MVRENDEKHLISKLEDLLNSLRQNEGKNGDMYYNISRLFARYSSRRECILKKTLVMMEFAIMLQPDNAEYLTEIAF
jgi:hypothetical protein